MSCYKPFLRLTDNGLYGIPCGWCMSCRLDHRQQLEHRCEYEFVTHNYVGAFVTFTYDDQHLYYQRDPSLIRSIAGDHLGDYMSFYNNFEPSLCFHHFDNFIRRVHSYVAKHPNPPFVQSDFSYLTVGEYGHDFDRPHYHTLFFGLDFMAIRQFMFKIWKNGLIDSLPILNGGIRYVLKYLDKQQHGEQNDSMYFDNFLEPPFMTFSQSLGTGLYYDQIDFCRQTGNYHMHGKDIPLPQYFKDKLLRVEDFERVKFDSRVKSYELAKKRFNELTQTLHASESYYKIMKERGLISQARLYGEAVDDVYINSIKRYV